MALIEPNVVTLTSLPYLALTVPGSFFITRLVSMVFNYNGEEVKIVAVVIMLLFLL